MFEITMTNLLTSLVFAFFLLFLTTLNILMAVYTTVMVGSICATELVLYWLLGM